MLVRSAMEPETMVTEVMRKAYWNTKKLKLSKSPSSMKSSYPMKPFPSPKANAYPTK